MKPAEKLQRSIEHWQSNPRDWVRDKIGDDVFLPTTQQEQAYSEIGKLVSAKLKVHHKQPLSPEEEVYARKIGISISSGQGCGKTRFAASVIMWFMDCFYDALIPVTANNAKQLRNVLWSEISKVMAMSKKVDPKDPTSKSVLDFVFEWQSERISHKSKQGKSWFAEAITVNRNATSDEQANTLAGRHEKFMMIVVEEAAGVPDAAMNPLEGTLTDPVNFILMISNPIRSKGFFAESHHSMRDKWVALRWNAEESERVTKEHCEYMEEKYGRDSTPYRVRVLGLFPLSDSDTLIPMDWIQDAVDRTLEPSDRDVKIQGCDVGAGGDKSVSIIRYGPKVYPPQRNNSPDTGTLARWFFGIRQKEGVWATYIDNIGIGWGVYCYMRNDLGCRMRMYAADFRGKAVSERFHNKRSESYWRLRELFEAGAIDLCDDQDLIDQLSVIKYDTESGKVQIWKKSKIKKELEGDSPDDADALAETCYHPVSSMMLPIDEPEDAYDEDSDPCTDTTWMSA